MGTTVDTGIAVKIQCNNEGKMLQDSASQAAGLPGATIVKRPPI